MARLRRDGFDGRPARVELRAVAGELRDDPLGPARRGVGDLTMSGETRPERTALSLNVLDQINRICDRFEAAWESGARPRIEDRLAVQANAIGTTLILLSVLLLLRIMLRSVWLAALGFVMLNTVLIGLAEAEPTYSTWLGMALALALCAWVLVRFGLLANVTATVVFTVLYLPVTTDSFAFYFGNGLLVMGLVLVLALYGSFTSLGGRPLFRDT